jgi:gamma-glutamyltranspeptidase/glutathione hydrolase
MRLANPETTRPTLAGSRHAISAGHPAAAMAGFRVLEGGGNAVDAAVAAGFVLHVVKCDMANLGGVAPILAHDAASGRVTAVAGIGAWPMAASIEKLRAAGGGRIPAGPERWVVPAAVEAWFAILARQGTMSVADVLADAIEIARAGFPANYFIRNNLAQFAASIPTSSDNYRIFRPGGVVPPDGTLIRQPELADTLQRLVDAERAGQGSRVDGIRRARDAFYKGEIAHRIAAFAKEVGGFLAYEDLAGYEVQVEAALSVRLDDVEVFGCGPWCQGPAFLQTVAMMNELGPLAGADRAEMLLGCVLSALRDRNSFYGDPDRVAVPLARLLSPAHARECVERLGRGHAAGDAAADPAAIHGLTPDTTYVCTTDRWGNAVSATPSDSTIVFTPMVPGLGFGVSDRGHQASLDPADPNCVAPGKRPRMTPNPALAKGRDFVLAFGTPGGEVQVQAMVQFLWNHLRDGLSLQAAIEAPRWASYDVPTTEDPHTRQPGLVCVESRAPQEVRDRFTAAGLTVAAWEPFTALAGGVCAVRRENDGRVAAGADPRRLSYAVAR